jgi:hypothetical protein
MLPYRNNWIRKKAPGEKFEENHHETMVHAWFTETCRLQVTKKSAILTAGSHLNLITSPAMAELVVSRERHVQIVAQISSSATDSTSLTKVLRLM